MILEKIKDYLKKNSSQKIDYHIPSLWLNVELSNNTIKKDYYTYYLDIINQILEKKKSNTNYHQSLSKIKQSITAGNWLQTASIYNCFPRLFTTYNHDFNRNLENDSLNDKTTETGTFLKAIALLPYIQQLGCNVVHLMPITSIGKDGNRGDLGSPYAIKNQYMFDSLLADPLIPFSVEDQFKAFVEAAHILDIRVVMEFVLRTSSLDGDWVVEHPEWFYWIEKKHLTEYKSPVFTEQELMEIKEIPYNHSQNYIPPPISYRKLFKKPPNSEQITLSNDGKYIAITEEGELVIPGAFADWPPDDIQPAWTDVTYLRMYNYDYEAENNYNYIAYNTIRYYDPILSNNPKNINKPLWDKLIGVIPYYQKEFGIDGVMLDMGHALPKELLKAIITKAREEDPDFGLMEENFLVEEKSKELGFNAALGAVWDHILTEKNIKSVVYNALNHKPIYYLGAIETHNTPRIASKMDTLCIKQFWTIINLLPSVIPFIHNGLELLETFPINTGLRFNEADIELYADKPIGLFYKNSFNWNTSETIIPFIKKIAKFRQKHLDLITHKEGMNMLHVTCHYEHVIAFERVLDSRKILVVVNTNFNHTEEFTLYLDGNYPMELKDYLTGNIFYNNHSSISGILEHGQCLIFEV